MRRFLRRLGRVMLLAIGFTLLVLLAQLLPIFGPYHDVFVVVMVIVAPVVLFMELRRQARLATINGNLLLIREALTTLRLVIKDPVWDSLPPRVRKNIAVAEDQLGTVATYYQGFRDLADTRRALLIEAGLWEEEDAP